MSITAAALRAAALSMPGTYEDYPFGPETAVFKVKAPSSGGSERPGKVFALGNLESSPMSISLKCDPELAPALRSANPGITGGYHLNKRHWNTVDTAQVASEMVLEMLEDSYDLVVAGLPKKQQEALEWSAYVAKS
ncbi:Predicted DNA-binding protein, MmcQ/YjbR family [Arthrobacter alpinus]|uniref:Predicted DNA-binding protein, MmcQ/YjbR family n=1 Tax=Arthrobacter alpinus TaxID=656366 RepID=A0A0U3QIP8_9MICC|nr:MmcQ/YjbR family DNA-binding protein [Arthrobacter alpinus]ALV46590.1 MmcQ-like protein [Arthrobacter alpinus]SEE97481.1 Predicted DNA-binding protein, MmcQ/YjbR family [Arthrobacter alpinus]